MLFAEHSPVHRGSIERYQEIKNSPAVGRYEAVEGLLLQHHEQCRASGTPPLPLEPLQTLLACWLKLPPPDQPPTAGSAALREQYERVSAELERLVGGCLSYEPADRPAFGGSGGVVVALERLLSLSKPVRSRRG